MADMHVVQRLSVLHAPEFLVNEDGFNWWFWRNSEATEQQRWERSAFREWGTRSGFSLDLRLLLLGDGTWLSGEHHLTSFHLPERRLEIGGLTWRQLKMVMFLGSRERCDPELVMSEWSTDKASSVDGSRWGSASQRWQQSLHLVDGGAHTIRILKTDPVSMLLPRPDFSFLSVRTVSFCRLRSEAWSLVKLFRSGMHRFGVDVLVRALNSYLLVTSAYV